MLLVVEMLELRLVVAELVRDIPPKLNVFAVALNGNPSSSSGLPTANAFNFGVVGAVSTRLRTFLGKATLFRLLRISLR